MGWAQYTPIRQVNVNRFGNRESKAYEHQLALRQRMVEKTSLGVEP
jgi:hypothetical protein